ncbi:MAG: hypothetical protein KJP21_02035, partial [Bacteroidia bacterium]|nr:hypothetical protein [Bacteroidia bacterium]
YRRWHNLSHKNPLSDESDLSFLNNQPFSKRLVPAIILTLIFGYITWMFGHLNLIYTILTFALLLVGVLLAFYTGPLILNALPGKLKEANKALKKIDALEQDIKSTAEAVLPKSKEEAKPIEEEIKPEKKKDDNWRKGVKGFLDK